MRYRVTCDGYTIHLVRFITEAQARALHAHSDSIAAATIKQGVGTTLWAEQFGRNGMTTTRKRLDDRLLP